MKYAGKDASKTCASYLCGVALIVPARLLELLIIYAEFKRGRAGGGGEDVRVLRVVGVDAADGL